MIAITQFTSIPYITSFANKFLNVNFLPGIHLFYELSVLC